MTIANDWYNEGNALYQEVSSQISQLHGAELKEGWTAKIQLGRLACDLGQLAQVLALSRTEVTDSQER